MDNLLHIRIYENQALVFSTDVAGTLELGRQRTGEKEPFRTSEAETPGASRIVIARFDETNVSRRHALLEPLSGERVRLRNLSSGLPIGLGDEKVLKAGSKTEVALPHRLSLGGKTISIEGPERMKPSLDMLDTQTFVPGQPVLDPKALTQPVLAQQEGVDAEAMIRLLQTAIVVLQGAATSKDFFHEAAKAVIQVAGLDSGAVLLHEHGGWKAAAFYEGGGGTGEPSWRPSRHVLHSVREQKRTVWQEPQRTGKPTASLAEVQAVVAAPILNEKGELLGALYGDRRSVPGQDKQSALTRVEAMLVELLASGVAAGLARLDQERAALAARVKFEQFFTPELSRQLELQPDLLKGKDTEVSILIAGIRGFSAISERLGPEKTVDWIRDVLASHSHCVNAHQGVLVDYVGDELMAMWGAPQDQPDHPELACRAALDMLNRLPRLNERWERILEAPVDIGIGINTGVARVGNVGSDRKFKYGPLGSAVNLASRAQEATKYLKARLITTDATQRRLGSEFETRKLCTVRVVNIREPVELFELAPLGDADFSAVQQDYDKALLEFERGGFKETVRLLGRVLSERPEDGPAQVLMSRAIRRLTEEPASFDSIWELPGE